MPLVPPRHRRVKVSAPNRMMNVRRWQCGRRLCTGTNPNHLPGKPALLRQLMQRILHVNVQNTGQFLGEEPAWRTIDE
jgi:hypothetical protein